jgi:uncharacterized glyoxalase superfamily protein PhnB
MAINRVSHITVYVSDQEEALAWYQDKLGFEKCMDNDAVVSGMRWLTVCPAGNQATQFALVLAREEADKSRIADMARLAQQGVEIVGPPEEVPWGVSGVIRDLYGNPYNLVGTR